MKTISLRFVDHYAPTGGVIAAHQAIIDKVGHVWYGKSGNTISNKIIQEIKANDNPVILLVNSVKTKRYWAHIKDIQKITPPLDEIPEYYRYNAEKFKVWFKVTSFESAPENILSRCYLISSGQPLGQATLNSMNTYFIIIYTEE